MLPLCLRRRECFQIDPERYDLELRSAADADIFVDLAQLLRRDHDYLVGRESREQPFDGDKNTGFQLAIVTVKDVVVKSVNDANLASAKRQQFVEPRRTAPDGPRLGSVCVN